jgi:hypothetical protein
VFLMVEAGDPHVTVLDGDRLQPVYRFARHSMAELNSHLTAVMPAWHREMAGAAAG